MRACQLEIVSDSFHRVSPSSELRQLPLVSHAREGRGVSTHLTAEA